ncbi:MAG: F0F1 ATP synthase subunit alpha, partial [Aeriscardovia sp.]|nr:F0F1 ATP synthase subunit alpha [Aeriscardovia sp.]
MTDLKIDPGKIRQALEEFAGSYSPSSPPSEQVGRVVNAGDGIARVSGLPGCMSNELLAFEGGVQGLAFNLEEQEIGAVILGDFSGIEEGQPVKRTGKVLSVPVGDAYLGRVVDPLGRPIDGLGEIKCDESRIL